MRTAYYKRRSGQIVSLDAESLKLDEGFSLLYDKDSLFCPSCGERVFYAGGAEAPEPGRNGVRVAHFKHQKRQNCVVEDCDLRVDVDADCYISQKLRMPLFLRPSSDGSFVLSAGFSTANKSALRRLQANHFKALSVSCGQDVIEISLEDLLESDSIVYADIQSPVTKRTHVTMAMTGCGLSQSLSASNEEWSDLLDCFVDYHGAVFQYSAGNAGEKLRAGSLITSGRPYLLLEKEIHSEYIQTPYRKLIDKYSLVYEQKGYLNFSGLSARYAVHKVVFPSAAELEPSEYDALFEYLREKFGVLLTDELKETRPLWPPAVRKSDAYGVQSKQVYLVGDGVDDGEILYFHRSYEATDELRFRDLNSLRITRVQLLTRRTPVSFEGLLAGSVASYRNETLKQPPIHGIALVDRDMILTQPGQYELPYCCTLALSASCEFSVYRDGHDAITYAPGEVVSLDVKPGERLLLRTCAGMVFDILMQNKSQVSAETPANRGYQKYDRNAGRYDRY